MQKHLQGGTFPASVARAFADAERACARGLGPCRQAEGIPLAELLRLKDIETPYCSGGPLHPVRCMVAGT
eukprot:3327429-Amphidinium_carterae.1